MLSQADAELTSRDRDLPGLARLLDAGAMAEELVSLGFRNVVEVVPDYVRYKPGSSCLVGYSLQFGESVIRAHAKIFASQVGAKAEKAQSRALREFDRDAILDRGGQISLSGPRAILCFFPCDADLPMLRRFKDPIEGPRLRKRVFRDHSEPPLGPLEVLAYKPERRLVAHLPCSRNADRANASLQNEGYVVRFFSTSDQERASRRAKWIQDGDRLRIAKRVGGSKRYNIAALEWLPGADLRDFIRFDALKASESLELVSQAIAELHHSPAVVRPELPSSDPRRGLLALARDIAWLSPSSAGLAYSLADRITSALSGCRCERKLIHGDLYDKQIILMDRGVGLLDLDQISIGDPRQDLGLFLAHWERDRILGQLGGWHGEIAEALVHHYERATDAELVGLPIFVAAALFRLAQHPFRMRLSDWPRIIDSILYRVGELMEQP